MDRDQYQGYFMQEEVEKNHPDERNDHQGAYTLQDPQQFYDEMDGRVSEPQIISAQDSFYYSQTNNEAGVPSYHQSQGRIQNAVVFQNQTISSEPIDAQHSVENQYPRIGVFQAPVQLQNTPWHPHQLEQEHQERLNAMGMTEDFDNIQDLTWLNPSNVTQRIDDYQLGQHTVFSGIDNDGTAVQDYSTVPSLYGSDNTYTPLPNEWLWSSNLPDLPDTNIPYFQLGDSNRPASSHQSPSNYDSNTTAPYFLAPNQTCHMIGSSTGSQPMSTTNVPVTPTITPITNKQGYLKCHHPHCLGGRESFTHFHELQQHIQSDHWNDVRSESRFICWYCGRDYSQIWGMIAHVNYVHNLSLRCRHRDCRRSIIFFAQQCELEDHVKSKHLGSKWLCMVCGHTASENSARAKYNLIKHIAAVHNVDTFWCAHSDCEDSKYFTQNFQLKEHIASAHVESHLLCLFCGYETAVPQDLKRHVAKHGAAELEQQGLHVSGYLLYEDSRQRWEARHSGNSLYEDLRQRWEARHQNLSHQAVQEE